MIGEHFVFLGGTCNDTTWRDELKSMLTCSYFDPIVDEWTNEAQDAELQARIHANYILYVLTPRMTGIYTLAELVDDSNKRPSHTLFVILKHDVNEEGKRITYLPEFNDSLEAIAALAIKNGAQRFDSLDTVANFLNNAT